MPIGGSQTIVPGDHRNTILQWSFPRSNRPEQCLYDIDEGAEIVLLVTYEVILAPGPPGFPPLPPGPTADVSDAFVVVVVGVDTGRGGVVHRDIEVDLAEGFQLSAPALSMTVFGAYPIVEGIEQLPLFVRASVGRGGHGCGCPTRTLRVVAGGPLLPIPVLAYSAILLAPAPAPAARLLQYALGGALLADSPITPETGIEAKVVPGAVFFGVANVPPGSRVVFKLSA